MSTRQDTMLVRMVPALIVAVAALATIAFVACGDNVVDPAPITFPATGVSFNGHVKPLFEYDCAVSGCHDGPRDDNKNVGLETYAQVIGSGIVSISTPERSRLAQVLKGQLLHPSDALFLALTGNQREGVIQWIREGALNN